MKFHWERRPKKHPRIQRLRRLQGSSVLPYQSWHNRPVTAPVLVGNLEYSNQDMKKKETRKMKYYEKNVSGKLTVKV